MVQNFLMFIAPVITFICALLLSFWIADKDDPIK